MFWREREREKKRVASTMYAINNIVGGREKRRESLHLIGPRKSGASSRVEDRAKIRSEFQESSGVPRGSWMEFNGDGVKCQCDRGEDFFAELSIGQAELRNED